MMPILKTTILNTTVTLGVLCSVMAAPSLAGNPNPILEQLRTFATCSGRLSAAYKAERATPIGAAYKRDNQMLRDILDAVTPEDKNRDVELWRLQAERALSDLLHRAFYSLDARSARIASNMVSQQLRTCRALLLS